jgi:starch synthase
MVAENNKEIKNEVKKPKKGSTCEASQKLEEKGMAAPEKTLPESSGLKLPRKRKAETAQSNSRANEAKPIKILYAAAECYPFIATGGLGDVMGSLPVAVKNEGADVRVVIPMYADISATYRPRFKFLGSTEVPLAWRRQYCGVFFYEYNNVTFYFIDNEYYFGRHGLYGHYDDGERFAFFSRSVIEILRLINFTPDIIHCNDWHTALIPVYLKTLGNPQKIKTVFTIHNIEYQGKYSEDILEDVFALPRRFYSLVEYNGCINLVKGAVQCCDMLLTVSPTYAEEIMTSEHSQGLDYIIRDNRVKVKGILNGIDYSVYNPQTDNALFKNYGANTFEFKEENKKGLQKLLNLPEDASLPLIAVISRLVSHKGMDLIFSRLEEILKEKVQLVILGKGEAYFENMFLDMQKTYSEKMRAVIAFNSDLARKIYAAADIFLMPSRSEPCGLSQMIAARYGAVPIVRQTGGLADTVKDASREDGNGFAFNEYNAGVMLAKIKEALTLYHNKEKWTQLVKKAMSSDFSWKKSAKQYADVYKEILNK